MMNKDNSKFVFKVFHSKPMTTTLDNFSNHVDKLLTLKYSWDQMVNQKELLLLNLTKDLH